MRPSRGFTLIELLVVVAIIAITAGVVVPRFVDLRTLVNAQHARMDLDQIFRAQRDFQENDLDGDGIANYAHSLAELSASSEIDETLLTGEAHGYRFRMRSAAPFSSWTARAVPVEPCVTGNVNITIDHTRTFTEEPADGPACHRDEIGKDEAHAMEQLGNLAKVDIAAAAEILRKGNPNLVGTVLAGMDRNQDGQVTIDEVLKGDYLALARGIKGNLVFPQEWDVQAGKDEKVERIVEKFVERLRKDLKLGIGNEDAPPPPPQDQVP